MKPYARFTSPDTKPTYINPIDLEVRPGVKVRDLETPAECVVAIQELETEISNISSQIAKVDAGTKQVGEEWRRKAESARRWKKRTLKALRVHAGILGGLVTDASTRQQQAILDVIAEDVGADMMERYLRIARHRNRELFPPVDKSNNGEKSP